MENKIKIEEEFILPRENGLSIWEMDAENLSLQEKFTRLKNFMTNWVAAMLFLTRAKIGTAMILILSKKILRKLLKTILRPAAQSD